MAPFPLTTLLIQVKDTGSASRRALVRPSQMEQHDPALKQRCVFERVD
jgi:hypothetical protein